MTNKKQAITLEQLKDKYIGLPGSKNRDRYEIDLSIDVLGKLIKQVRKQRKLTQQELGDLVGVQKAQISKLETNARNVTLITLLKVFNSMKANVRLQIELQDVSQAGRPN